MSRKGSGAANRVRELREARHLTQEDLALLVAARLGRPFNGSQISKIEQGQSDFDPEEIVAFAKALKVRTWELFREPTRDEDAAALEEVAEL